jgi:GNAT superfamily N-acetyltransferase
LKSDATKLRIRQLEPGERALLRAVRLAALKESPDQFAEQFAEAEQRSEEGWERYLQSVTQDGGAAAFLAEIDGPTVGMVLALHGAEARIGRLGGLWVAPRARRLGVGTALASAVRGWATEHRKEVIRLWVVPGTAGESLYRRLGFVPLGNRREFPGDASREIAEFELSIDLSQPRAQTT